MRGLIAALALIAAPAAAQVDPGARAMAAAARLAVPARLGVIQTRKAWSGTGEGQFFAGYTWRILTSVECPYSWVRLHVDNGLASAYTITGAKVARTAAVGDAQTPSEGAAAYTQVTWGTNNAVDRPPSAASAVTSIAVPAATGTAPNLVHGSVVSDWLQLTALPRTDGGQWPLLLAEFYVAGQPAGQNNAGSGYTGYQAILGSRTYRTTYGSGDHVSSFALNAQEDGYQPNFGVGVECQKRGLSVLAVGDSLTQGLTTTSSQNGFPFQLQALLSTPALPVSVANAGTASQTMAFIAQNAKKYVDLYAPDVVIVPAWSPNDGSTQAAFDADWALAVSVADYAVAHGSVPILTTSMPWNLSGSAEAARLAQNVRAKASGYLVADFDAAVSDNAGPAHIRAPYLGTDNAHLSDAGQGATAAAAAVPLRRIIAALVR